MTAFCDVYCFYNYLIYMFSHTTPLRSINDTAQYWWFSLYVGQIVPKIWPYMPKYGDD